MDWAEVARALLSLIVITIALLIVVFIATDIQDRRREARLRITNRLKWRVENDLFPISYWKRAREWEDYCIARREADNDKPPVKARQGSIPGERGPAFF